MLDPHRGLPERLVGGAPDLTLADLHDRLRQRCGIGVGLATLHGMPDAIRQLQDDQTVMIRMLQARKAEIDVIRSRERPSTDRTWHGRLERLDAQGAPGFPRG